MRAFRLPAIIGVLIAIIGGVINAPALVGAGVAVTLASLAVGALRQSKNLHTGVPGEDLRPETRARLKPLTRIHNEIQLLVDATPKSNEMRTMAQIALQESAQSLKDAEKMLAGREIVQKILRGKLEAQKDADDLQSRLNAAPDGEERTTLEQALNARRSELTHYEQADKAITQIDQSLEQIEAALAELKARLSIALASPDLEQETELDGTVNRLKSLSGSFDEVEEFLKVNS